MSKESNGRVTLAVLGTKLDTLTDSFNEFKQGVDRHLAEYKQTQFDVDRLKVADASRRWHFRAIWTAILSFAGAVSTVYFK